MMYLVDGVEMSLVPHTGNRGWYGHWMESGEKKSRYFGLEDPRPRYTQLTKRKYERVTSISRQIDGVWVTCKPKMMFCNSNGCKCRKTGVKHGPYWMGYYTGTDGKRHGKYIGKELPPEE